MTYGDYDNAIREGMDRFQRVLDAGEYCRNLRITPSTKLYRYVPKDFFLDIIENRRLTMSHISLWDDPFEGFIFKAKGVSEDVRRMYAGFYGQSWTLEPRESDLRWRAYCPNKDGVRIETTVGKLKNVFMSALNPDMCFAQVVQGPIEYFEKSLKSWFDRVASDSDLAHRPISRRDATQLLFIKRDLFESEKEYRVVAHIGHTGLKELPLFEASRYERKEGLFRIPLNTESFIKGIVLDPRMSMSDVDRLRCRLIQSDCRLSLKQSDAYRWPNLTFMK